jgi:hypothetical protein
MTNEQKPSPENNRPRETDIEKIVQRHMQNEHDIITDEDIKYAKIGQSDETSTVGAEAEARLEEDEKKKPSDEPLTPWDLKS